MLLVSVPLAGAGATPYSLKDGEGLMGRFVQERHLRGFERPILSEGSFFLLPRASLVWQTELPFFGRMVIDDDGLIQSVDGVEVTRLSFKQFPGFKLLRDTLESSRQAITTNDFRSAIKSLAEDVNAFINNRGDANLNRALRKQASLPPLPVLFLHRTYRKMMPSGNRPLSFL